MKKKFFVIALLFLLIASTTFSMAKDSLSSVTGVFRNYNIFYQDAALSLDMDPVIIQNRTYLPLRSIAEALGLSITWEEEEQSIFINTPNLEELLPPTDPLAGEYFVYGEIRDIDQEEGSIEILQHFDHHSKEVFGSLKVNADAVVLLQRNTHYMEISFKDLKAGDVVGIVMSKDDSIRGIIIDI